MNYIKMILLSFILLVNVQILGAVRDLKPRPPAPPKPITSVPVDLPKGLAVVEICREGCGFCTKMNAVLKDYKDAPIIRLDAKPFKVQGTPTYIVFKDGKFVKQFVGYSDLKTFKERVK